MRARSIHQKLTGKSPDSKGYALSTPGIHRAVLRAVDTAFGGEIAGNYLDIGSGKGELLGLLTERYPKLHSFACDYTDRLMKRAGQKVEIVDLNREALPFGSDRFALITCIETVEHLESYWGLLREIYRVLAPGGTVILSTPNILNLRSRFRFFSSGFHNLFGPLMPDEKEIYSPRGHITPVSWFYLANALLSVGFKNLAVTVDKYQRKSILPFLFLIGPIRFSNRIALARERKKYKTIDHRNTETVRLMNSTDLLLGRTLIVSAKKPQ